MVRRLMCDELEITCKRLTKCLAWVNPTKKKGGEAEAKWCHGGHSEHVRNNYLFLFINLLDTGWKAISQVLRYKLKKRFGQITSHINWMPLSRFGRQMTDTEVYTFCVLLRIRETLSPGFCHLWLPRKQTHTYTHTQARVSYEFDI